MNLPSKYALSLITITLLAVLVCTVLFGWTEFTDKLGGLKSFGGLVAVLLMLLIVIGGIIYLQNQNYHDRMSARIRDLVIATAIVLILGAIGYNSIDLPDGAGMKVFWCMLLCAFAAFVTTWIGYVDDE